MATKRVIAYFMHEAEREFARPSIQNAEVTDSFLMGDIDENLIPNIQNAGLVVEEVTPGPGLQSLPTFEAVHDASKTRLLSDRGIAPTFGGAVSFSADAAT